jgi:Domain of unknown function (DUF4177)
MQRWEYRVLVRVIKDGNYIWYDQDKRDGEGRLNAMGLEGWELVQVVTLSRHESSAWAGTTTVLCCVFKRPVT